MERFVIIVNGFQPLTIITKCSILDVAAVLDPPLEMLYSWEQVKTTVPSSKAKLQETLAAATLKHVCKIAGLVALAGKIEMSSG